jgi:hypothetical protein
MKSKTNIFIFPFLMLGMCLILTNSCKKKDDSNPVLVALGDIYQGGKVAYLLLSGDPGYDVNVQHGIIVALSDQSTGIQWYNGSYTTTAATATALGTGNDNTATIVANQGTGNYAAKLCSDLVLNGYSDWFLPSKDELTKIYLNRIAIGGFTAFYYWSSSEYSNNNAWYFKCSDGYAPNTTKDNALYVRAVRTF